MLILQRWLLRVIVRGYTPVSVAALVAKGNCIMQLYGGSEQRDN
jgi:hypothetical protein